MGPLKTPSVKALSPILTGVPTAARRLIRRGNSRMLLAEAAKTPFPSVRFEPGVGKQTVKRPARFSASRWAVAACLLVAVGGAGYIGLSWHQHSSAMSRAQSDVASAQRQRDQFLQEEQTKFNASQIEINKIQEQLRAVENQYREELNRVKREFDSKPVQFVVSHPKTLQAGGANQISIEAKRRVDVGKDKEIQLVALVVDDKTKAEVARMALLEGRNDFVLPANLPLRPGTQLSLRVLAREAGNSQQIIMDEMLPLVTSLFVTHLTTDRPLYRPGEVVHFRSLTLERFSLKPADDDFVLNFRLVKAMGGQEQNVEVFDPVTGQPAQMIGGTRLKASDGNPLLGSDGTAIKGIGAGSFRLHPDLPGGEYTLIVSDAYERFPTERRKIIVNRYQAPRLYKDVDFTRKSYGPGDTVTATCKVAARRGRPRPGQAAGEHRRPGGRRRLPGRDQGPAGDRRAWPMHRPICAARQDRPRRRRSVGHLHRRRQHRNDRRADSDCAQQAQY